MQPAAPRTQAGGPDARQLAASQRVGAPASGQPRMSAQQIDRQRVGASHLSPSSPGRPSPSTRPYQRSDRPSTYARPLSRSTDHRYARPSARYVRPSPYTHYRPPAVYQYRPYYTRWYVHPYYRYSYSTTVVVGFGFNTYAWYDYWVPPARAGWGWTAGRWSSGVWWPGYWSPMGAVPMGYSYVPGWWDNNAYVEGYYRVQQREGWTWQEGYYLDDGTYVRGAWMPNGGGPDGYQWEAGFWDGETWVEGFWRPAYRSGFTWVSSYYDEDSVFHAGYWMPLEQRLGQVWVPGWFDGNTWTPGYWVSEQEYSQADPQSWQAPEGWHDGWEVGAGFGDGDVIENHSAAVPATSADRPDELVAPPEDIPLALPVDPEAI